MRVLTDGRGEVGIGYGARGLGSALPWPTEAALCFHRSGKTVTRHALPGVLDHMSDAELLAVLDSEPSR